MAMNSQSNGLRPIKGDGLMTWPPGAEFDQARMLPKDWAK
jgi:hypothetical protein